jgi:cystathionine beta-lyase
VASAAALSIVLHDRIVTDFDVSAIRLSDLQQRKSAKYRQYEADVIPAWVAEMDFPLAEPIASALHQAIDQSDTGYQSGEGLADATCDFVKAEWDWVVPRNRVVAIPDVLTGVAQSIELLTEPGDGVVINPPIYPPFFSTIRDITRRTIVDVPMLEEGGRYSLDVAGLAEAFARPDVSAFLLCSPHNPTGTVPSCAELEQIAALAAKHDVTVIADEIHAPLTLPGAVHTPYLTVAAPDARAVSLVAASKTWNLAGLKCAQMIGTDTTADVISRRLPREVTYGTGHLGVIATVAAYRHGGPWRRQVLGILDANRRLLTDLLDEHVPGARYIPPEASYLAWIHLPGWGDDPAVRILRQARVALNRGPTFGSGGQGHVRLNLATSPALLAEIVERIGTAAPSGG